MHFVIQDEDGYPGKSIQALALMNAFLKERKRNAKGTQKEGKRNAKGTQKERKRNAKETQRMQLYSHK